MSKNIPGLKRNWKQFSLLVLINAFVGGMVGLERTILPEFAGYVAVAVVAFLTGWIAAEFGLRPWPFFLGIVLAFLGLGMSLLLIRDTAPFVAYESKNSVREHRKKNLFREVTWGDRNLMAVSQAGMMTNFKDGMAWGAFPMFLAAAGLSLSQIGVVAAVYPIPTPSGIKPSE